MLAPSGVGGVPSGERGVPPGRKANGSAGPPPQSPLTTGRSTPFLWATPPVIGPAPRRPVTNDARAGSDDTGEAFWAGPGPGSSKGRDFTSETKQRLLGKEPQLLEAGGGGEERVGARWGAGERETHPSSGADTGGCGQGRALCRCLGRGAGVLENGERGAVGRAPGNPVWRTSRGGPFLGLRARRAIRLKRGSRSQPWSGSAGFPKTSQGAGALGGD